jgi:hypothetical protein
MVRPEPKTTDPEKGEELARVICGPTRTRTWKTGFGDQRFTIKPIGPYEFEYTAFYPKIERAQPFD